MTDTPPVAPFYVGHTLAYYNVAEVTIIVGQARTTIRDTPGSNHYGLSFGINWLSALTMSPQTAKHAWKQLSDCLAAYEAQFGPIAYDPAAEPPRIADNVVSMGDPRVAARQSLFDSEHPEPAA